MQIFNHFLRTTTPQLDSDLHLPHLTNYGGKIIKHLRVVPIYYGAYWNTVRGKKDRVYFDKFAKYLVRSKHTTVWAQYGAGKGTFGGSDVVSPTRTSRYFTEEDIQTLVWQELSQKRVKPEDGKTVYTVYLPPGTILTAPSGETSLDGLGGYHGSFNDPRGKKIYYAAIAYSEGENGIAFTEKAKDNITIVASHEWSEVVTDPDVNNGTLGWYDERYGEIGDIPLAIGMPLDQVYGRLDGYAIQKEWSNIDGQSEIVAQPR